MSKVVENKVQLLEQRASKVSQRQVPIKSHALQQGVAGQSKRFGQLIESKMRETRAQRGEGAD